MGARITKIDTDGVITVPNTLGDMSIDNHVAGGDAGRMYYNDGTSDIAVAKLEEVTLKDSDQSLAAGDAIDITGQTLTLTKGNGDTETAEIPVSNAPTASETVSGTVELATITETVTGTDTTRAVTPAGVASSIATNAPAPIGGTGVSVSGTTVNFYPYKLPTATTQLTSTDYVVVSDRTVPKKITLGNFAAEITSGSVSKNQCTAWVNFDGTTTPPTIRDSFNVSDVVRISTGVYDVYIDNITTSDYIVLGTVTQNEAAAGALSISPYSKSTTKFRVGLINTADGLRKGLHTSLALFGGKN